MKQSGWRPTPIRTRHDWQNRFKNLRIGKKGVEDIEKAETSSMAVPFFDENVYQMHLKNAAPKVRPVIHVEY